MRFYCAWDYSTLRDFEPPAPYRSRPTQPLLPPLRGAVVKGVSKTEAAFFCFGRSGASPKLLTMVARAVGCRSAGGEVKKIGE